MTINVAISPGELLDKLTILQIKLARIADSAKLRNIRFEYDSLSDAAHREIPPSPELATQRTRLHEINEQLWEVEDEIRECEGRQNFGPRFVELARSVYRLNDQRATIKREINRLLDSALVEEKSYRGRSAAR
jgi:hypothetical protein